MVVTQKLVAPVALVSSAERLDVVDQDVIGLVAVAMIMKTRQLHIYSSFFSLFYRFIFKITLIFNLM